MSSSNGKSKATNVLGGELQPCCMSPITGFYRDGFCHTGPGDYGLHTVCIEATEEFLSYSQKRGNDLTTPMPQYSFPGLKSGDHWCLCVTRWKEAFDSGMAPQVYLKSTHISALEFVDLDDLNQFAADADTD